MILIPTRGSLQQNRGRVGSETLLGPLRGVHPCVCWEESKNSASASESSSPERGSLSLTSFVTAPDRTTLDERSDFFPWGFLGGALLLLVERWTSSRIVLGGIRRYSIVYRPETSVAR